MDISFMSDEQVKACASFSVNERFDLYDERFGSIKSTSKCTTCGKTEMSGCYGHYGSLYLGYEIFHPMFIKEITNAINSTCQHCHSPIHPESGFAKTGYPCVHCGKVTYVDWNISPNQAHIIKRKHTHHTMLPSRCKIILENHETNKYIISHIIVPPTGIRPPEDVEWPSEISRIYTKLVDTIKSRNRGRYYKRISDLYNQIVGYLKQDGVMQALSGKQGIFRALMLGKRINRSARLVIVGDPNLDLDEILVPNKVTMGIRVPEKVFAHNVDRIKSLARDNKLWWHSEDEQALEDHVILGKIYDRTLCNGDPVLFNRQPSLTKHSLLAFRIKTSPYLDQDVFAFNPAVTPSFNADFDGDEMNIYAGYGLEAKAELLTICNVIENIYDPLNNKVLVHPIQDVISGVYMMSKNSQFVSEDVISKCIMSIGYNNIVRNINTRELLSLIIPADINCNNVIIDSKVEGTINKKILCHDLIIEIAIKHNNRAVANFIRDVQKLVLTWLDNTGFTIGLRDCAWSKKDLNEYQTKLPVSDDKDVADLQRWILDKVINEYHTEDSTNPLSIMLRSGSKGKDIGASHMAVSLGQQYVHGKKPTTKKNSSSPYDNGFIDKSYIKGLSSKDYFAQASASMSGIIDIGISVSAVGYANRRTSKLVSDVAQEYDGKISTAKQIVQF